MALAKEAAPHIRKQGEKLLPKSLKQLDNDGKSKLDGVLEVAASGLHGEYPALRDDTLLRIFSDDVIISRLHASCLCPAYQIVPDLLTGFSDYDVKHKHKFCLCLYHSCSLGMGSC